MHNVICHLLIELKNDNVCYLKKNKFVHACSTYFLKLYIHAHTRTHARTHARTHTHTHTHTHLALFSYRLSCSPLDNPVIRGEVGWPWLPLSFSSSFLSSINSLQFHLFHFSPSHSLQICLRASSHHILGLPHLLFPSTFWA